MIIEFDEHERQALFRLIDAAVRTIGIPAMKEASVWLEKLDAAGPNETLSNEVTEHV